MRFELAEIVRGFFEIRWLDRMRHLCHQACGHIGHRRAARAAGESLNLFDKIVGWQAQKTGVFRPSTAIGQVAIPARIAAFAVCVKHDRGRKRVRIWKPIDRLQAVKL